MVNEEIIAKRLGFESAEEMEKYYDLCWDDFKADAILERKITKAAAAESIRDNGTEHLLSCEKVDRLLEMANCKFDGLRESILCGDVQSEQYFRNQMDFLLSEAKKAVDSKDFSKKSHIL